MTGGLLALVAAAFLLTAPVPSPEALPPLVDWTQAIPSAVHEAAPLAQLTAKQQKKLDKLIKKHEKLQAKLDAAEVVLADAELAVTEAEDAVDAVALMPEGTIWEYLAKKDALKPAEKALKKAEKKASKAQGRVDKLETKLGSLEAAIEALEAQAGSAGTSGDDDDDDGGGDDDDDSDGSVFDGGPPSDDGDDDGIPAEFVSMPILVQEALPSGAGGVNRPVTVATFGVPFPQGQVPVTSGRPGLAVAGSSKYQFRTLDTWPDGTVKWALCDLQTGLDAGEVLAGLEIVGGDGESNQGYVARIVGDDIVLDTGPLEARIQMDDFNLFKRITVDGVELADSSSFEGFSGRTINNALMTPGPGTTVVIEENGPVRALVRADGTLQTNGGTEVIDFTCRIIARVGSRDLEVQTTVRNANPDRRIHNRIRSLELALDTDPGGNRSVEVARHNGSTTYSMSGGDSVSLYQAQTSAFTYYLDSGDYYPHIPKVQQNTTELVQQGYRLKRNGSTVHGLGNKSVYPKHGFLELSGADGGVTISIQHMAYHWPATLEGHGNGTVIAGLWPEDNTGDYTFTWRQHESRTAVFSFFSGSGPNPEVVAKRLDWPVAGRAADFKAYDQARVFPYRLVTVAEQNLAYDLMGVNHAVQATNSTLNICRYLASSTTGGDNNYAKIEDHLAGHWLRQGFGGHYLTGLSLALWKSEWQIRRSDGFNSLDAGEATNQGIPHTTKNFGDDEHRYREGMVLAYYLTGDERHKEALADEEEWLHDIFLWGHERSMYQTLRAMAYVADFTNSSSLKQKLRQRLAYITQPVLDVDFEDGGIGWQTSLSEPESNGDRRYYVNSGDMQNEQPPGEEFITRGFMTGSLGPLGYYHAAHYLGDGDTWYDAARRRMRDLSYYTREELFPYRANPAQRWLVYSYSVQLQQANAWENVDFHPIVLGMYESWKDTGDGEYMDRAVEQVEAWDAHGDLDEMDTRLDCQHFFHGYLQWALAGE